MRKIKINSQNSLNISIVWFKNSETCTKTIQKHKKFKSRVTEALYSYNCVKLK